MKTVALKDPNSGSFKMIRLTGFGTISSDDREQYGTRVSLGNVKTSLDLKESRLVILEDDKVVKDSKISALEDDKAVKDTKISNIESDIELLASQVSLGNVRVSVGNLATRVSSLETLGISGISNAVSWTNLTEINLSGEKLTNGDFSSVTNNAPTNWTVTSGTLDQTKLASGIVKGDGGQVSIQQTFSQNIAQGTDLVIKVTSDDDIKFYPILSNGTTPDNANSFDVLASNGYAEHTTQTVVSGFRISTVSSSREYSSVSVFQGAVSGGTVQAYAGGGLEKISGASGYNSGGFSVNYIPGNSDGYFQFQLAQNNKALRVGLVYSDTDYSTVSPFGLDFNATGNIDNMNPYQDNITTYAQGDWFRVRHYASSNQVHFQKRGTVYVDDADFCLLQTCGLQPNNGHQYNHTFATVDRPLIIAKETVNGLTTGEYYRIHAVNTSSGNTRIYTLDGVQIGWMTGRGTNWEVQTESGQDYFTFLTSSTTTNGSDLYLDVAFDSVGGRINDVTIVT